jgi:hypothetical protein
MNGMNVTLNLASGPQRNRRFFTALIAALAIVFLLIAAFSVLTFVRNRSREAVSNEGLARVEKMTQDALKEKNQWDRQARDWTKNSENAVAIVNGIIRKKSFSWVDFFSRLEEALPLSSYITAMTPVLAGEGPTDVQFKVVSQTLNDLLALLKKLDAQGFKNISVRNENPTAGQLISEINIRHERPL